MNKILLILFFIFLVSIHASNKDSLALQLEALDNQDRVPILLELSTITKENEPTKSLTYAEEALELAKLWGENRFEAKANNAVGNAHFFSGRFPDALYHYTKSIKQWGLLKDSTGLSIALNNVGMVYSRIGSHYKAMDYILRGIELKQSRGEQLPIAISYLNLGNTFIRIKDYEKAKDYYSRAKTHFEDVGDKYGVNLSINNIGISFMLLGKYETALPKFLQYLAYGEKSDSPRDMSRAYTNLGELFFRQKKYEKSLEYYEHAYDLKIAHGESSQIASINHDLAGALMGLGRFTDALKYEMTSKNINNSLDLSSSLADNYDRLSSIYSKLADERNAFLYLQKFMVLKDSLDEKNEAEKLAQLRVQMEVENMENTIKVQTLTLSQQRSRMILMSFIIGLGVILVAGLIHRHYYMKRISKEKQIEKEKIHHLELEKKEQEVEQTKKELLTKAMYMTRNRETILDIQSKMESNEANERTRKQIANYFSNQAEWADFENWFTEVHSNFFRVLANNYPEITPTEKKLCAFLKLNLNTKEIASLMNLSVKTIEVYRTKLRKKLNLDHDQNLNQFFETLD